jgi:hypothetical protein
VGRKASGDGSKVLHQAQTHYPEEEKKMEKKLQRFSGIRRPESVLMGQK